MEDNRRSTLADERIAHDGSTDAGLTGDGQGAACATPEQDANVRSVDVHIADIQSEAGDLIPVADQLVAIAEQLRSGDLSSALASLTGGVGSFDKSTAKSPASNRSAAGLSPHANAKDIASQRRDYAQMARRAYDVRRTRGTFFGDPDLFGEPAWDILLDLYVAHVDSKAVSVSSACIGSAAPPTTGLRWLGVLAEHGLVLREHDPEDQRRVLVRLTDTGLEAMDRYFAEAVKRGAAC